MHWYNDKGEPCHTSIGAKGQEVKTTLTHARKRGLYPSTTTILALLDKPSLKVAGQKKVAQACYDNPPIQKGQYIATPDAYAAQMINEAFEDWNSSADIGNVIDDAICSFFEGREWDGEQEIEMWKTGQVVKVKELVLPAIAKLKAEGITLTNTQKVLVNKKHGYAGTMDAEYTMPDSRGIADIKTTTSEEGKPMKGWDDHPAQLASYHMARYGKVDTKDKALNIYISTTEIGRVELVWRDSETLENEFNNVFLPCLKIWSHRKKYQPGIEK